MKTENMIRIIAGLFILVSLGLGIKDSPIFHSSNWLWFTAFVGFNLLQSGFTKFCPMEMLLNTIFSE